jgi:hypothetical protein
VRESAGGSLAKQRRESCHPIKQRRRRKVEQPKRRSQSVASAMLVPIAWLSGEPMRQSHTTHRAS